ncbi:hypothetical protein PSEUBRA_000603 [Kalmanozyma brasiliensis GHG001]|uniref:uncharacterized protein n=1 Tax=Kalmanozyma brasiliensis (strain GHG001) TaxID=1365824 RepID=UPI002867C534|nr:uncharacterized protein PSEUBRA_000603 [Kalmanozyma brasiliensis GHG001]KAF6766828.1 hypothetical protein PSEUBRA_000603 [Kalmanozyma brasiliensis GHG001]
MRRPHVVTSFLVALLFLNLFVGAVQGGSVGRSVASPPRDRPPGLVYRLIHSLADNPLVGSPADGRKRQLDWPSLLGVSVPSAGMTDATAGRPGHVIPASVLAAAASKNTAGPTATAGYVVSSPSPLPPPSSTASPTSSPLPTSSTVATPSAPLTSILTPPATTDTPTSLPTSTTTPISPTHHSLLSPKNRLFPLTVAALAAAALIFLMLLISIARSIARALYKDHLTRSYAFEDPLPPFAPLPGQEDKFTTPACGLGAARSVRRAMRRSSAAIGDELVQGWREKMGVWRELNRQNLSEVSEASSDGGAAKRLSRLGSHLRKLTTTPLYEPSQPRQSDVASCTATITADGEGWTIEPSRAGDGAVHLGVPAPPPVVRKPVPQLEPALLSAKLADLERQCSSRRERKCLSTDATGAPITERTKSHQEPNNTLGRYRRQGERKEVDSVPLASPTRWERVPSIVVHPERPPIAVERPLPTPPILPQ